MLRLSYTKWNHQFPIHIFSDQAVNIYTFYQWPELIVFFLVIYVNWWIRCQVLRMLNVKNPLNYHMSKHNLQTTLLLGALWEPILIHKSIVGSPAVVWCSWIIILCSTLAIKLLIEEQIERIKLFIHSIIIIIIIILLLLLTYMNQSSLL